MSFFSRKGPGAEQVPALPYDPRSPEGLAARWVQWVAAAGPLKNPVADETGEHAAVNQPDDIWFLAGSYGERVERRCVVPDGRDLFLPAFNMWHAGADGPPPVMERASGTIVLDGKLLEPDVIATPVPFTVAGARLNGVTRSKRAVPTTVWGLWKRIPALAPGQHQLRVTGGDGYGFTVDVSYRLTVSEGIPAATYPANP
jgi:hypothetical protein